MQETISMNSDERSMKWDQTDDTKFSILSLCAQ